MGAAQGIAIAIVLIVLLLAVAFLLAAAGQEAVEGGNLGIGISLWDEIYPANYVLSASDVKLKSLTVNQQLGGRSLAAC